MKKQLLCVLLALCVMGTAFSRETTLPKRQVSSEAILDMLDEDFAEEAYVDEEGDLFIRYNGLKMYVFINESLDLVYFSASWKAGDWVDAEDAAVICNDWNKDYVFCMTYFTDRGSFVMQYYMTYAGGLSSKNLNESLDLYFQIADAFWDYLEDNDVFE